MVTSYFPPVKRPNKIPVYLREDLTFDLINAFGLVKNSFEAALLLKDLLTKSELNNLSKRLRIAKELLSGKNYDEVARQLHCSYGTVARVQNWLREGGEGLRRIVVQLPKRRKYPKKRYSTLPPQYRTPQIILDSIQHFLAYKEERKLKTFLELVEGKALTDKTFREAMKEFYRDKRSRQRPAL